MVAVLAFPAITPGGGSEFYLPGKTSTHRGPLTQVQRTEELGLPLWIGRLVFKPFNQINRRLMEAFLNRLRGAQGRFYYGHPYYLSRGPTGTASGTPLVNGAAQTGSSITLDGFGFSERVLETGDFLAWDVSGDNRELHQVIVPADSDGAGNATVSITPPIRTSPADDQAIIITGATCVMRLADDNQARMMIDRDHFGNAALDIVEAPQPLAGA